MGFDMKQVKESFHERTNVAGKEHGDTSCHMKTKSRSHQHPAAEYKTLPHIEEGCRTRPDLSQHLVDAREDLVPRDKIRWREVVLTPGKHPKYAGRREIRGVVQTGFVDGSEGPERLKIQVITSNGDEPILADEVITREVAILQRSKVVRELTDHEDERAKVRAELGKRERDAKWAALTERTRGRSAVMPAKPPAIALKQYHGRKRKGRKQ